MTRVVVWLVWAAGVAALAGMIDRYAGKNPYFDDIAYFGLNLLPKNASPADFWIPINEHRVPVPKCASWAVSRVGGYNLRNVMRASLAFLAVGTAACLWAAGRVRGRYRLWDAAVPLVMMSPGHAENVLWAVEINFLLPVGMGLVALALVVSGRTAVVAVPAVLMAGSGVQGQIPAAALGLWLLYCRTRASVAGGLLTLAVVGVCLAAYQRPAAVEPPEYGVKSLRFAVRVVGSAWGPVVEAVGPAEPHPLPAVLGLVTLGLVTVAGLWAAREGSRAALGGLAVLLGVLAVCLAIGVARGPMNQWKLADRYVTLAAPLLVAAYLLAGRCGPPRVATVLQVGICVGAILVQWPNAIAGLRYAEDRRQHHRLVEEDARRGVPASFFVDHHGRYLFPPNPHEVAGVFDALRNMHLFPYSLIPPELTLREVPAGWRFADGVLTLDLPPATRAVVLEYALDGPADVASEVSWDDAGTRRRVVGALAPGDGRRLRVWLGRPVGRLDVSAGGLRVGRVAALVE